MGMGQEDVFYLFHINAEAFDLFDDHFRCGPRAPLNDHADLSRGQKSRKSSRAKSIEIGRYGNGFRCHMVHFFTKMNGVFVNDFLIDPLYPIMPYQSDRSDNPHSRTEG